MNLFRTEKWWPYGKKIKRLIHNGQLPIIEKSKIYTELCITNRDEFFEFRNSLLPCDITSDIKDKVSTSKIVYNDLFLDDEYPIDYPKSISFVIIGHRIEEIYYSKLFDTNIIILEEGEFIENIFSVCICENVCRNEARFTVINKNKQILCEENLYDDY